MPEYLAPGVYVEDTSFRSRPIAGVDTTTAAFAGATRMGPRGIAPAALTSVAEFESRYGSVRDLVFAGGAPVVNYVAHAVRHFFANGGRRLYVARVYEASPGSDGVATSAWLGSGQARRAMEPAAHNDCIRFRAPTPGAAGNGTVSVRIVETQALARALRAVPAATLLRDGRELYLKQGDEWVGADGRVHAKAFSRAAKLVSVELELSDADGRSARVEAAGFAPGHPAYVGELLRCEPDSAVLPVSGSVPPGASGVAHEASVYGLETGPAVTPFRLYEIFAGLTDPVPVTGGNDGRAPGAPAYAAALEQLADIEDVSILAAPGYSALGDAERAAVEDAIVAHVDRPRAYRLAVLDAPPGQTVSEVLATAACVNSMHAALYYPWVVAANPLAGEPGAVTELLLPPSGFVCGIYARTALERGVAKAPANEFVAGALRLERDVTAEEQGLLNPRGVNCLRAFSGRGILVWGARTTSTDPEWKYVNVRRLLDFLEHSIERGTQWAVFEPNDETLWSRVRNQIGDFLVEQWRAGMLQGAKATEAFFVRCDRTTMTQLDLDTGRLICLVGVAPVRPAEFVIFRIGQKTSASH